MSVRNPLVVSILDLPRTPGSCTHHDVQWITPEDLGTPNMWVVPGTHLDIAVDTQAITDGVVAQVYVPVDLEGECVRCLDPVVHHHEVNTSQLYMEHSRRVQASNEENDQEQLWVEHDSIDIEPLLRDAIITLVDDRPLCRPDCPGLCPTCGEKWDDLPEQHRHDETDPRFAQLAALIDSARADDAELSYVNDEEA